MVRFLASGANGVKTYYGEWWENARDSRNLVFDRLNELVLNRIRLHKPGAALDLGSGRGRILSMLVQNGFSATAVEFHPDFVAELRAKFLSVTVISEDVRDWKPSQRYDLVTCIELTQVLTHRELTVLLKRLNPYAKTVLINISNTRSIHGAWVRLRRFQAPFIVPYGPDDLIRILEETGYRVRYSAGVGFVTPVSLFREFKVSLVSRRVATRFKELDKSFPRLCHLYLVEADAMVPEEG